MPLHPADAEPSFLQPANATLFRALLAAQQSHGSDTIILEDAERAPLSYGRLVLASLVMGGKLASATARGEAVGVLLPNVNGFMLTLFALNAFGRIAALLNFTAGAKNIRAAVRTAKVKLVITSRRFVAAAKLEDVIQTLTLADGQDQPARILYLEDLRRDIGLTDKVHGFVRSLAPRWLTKRAAPDSPAVIVFTSGTEGLPKGVVLSNRNLLANAFQISAHAGDALFADDIVFNPLPMFHSFGLTAAALMPILRGMRTMLYPSPLHYKQIPPLIRETGATVLFATDTFLQGYARAASDEDLSRVRVVVCGAERVKDATRELWRRWPTVILEGYGVTECSPVVACNLPATNAVGTVGALLPAIEVELEPVEGINGGGKLKVRGPNVMLGYMRHDKPGVIERLDRGWHDTGDIVSVEHDGLLRIKGRAKRFAKIGGEMVSLAAVETMVGTLWPDWNHVVVALPDQRKGEVLVLLTEKQDADRAALIAAAQREGVPELWVPRIIVPAGKIPLLGSGKVDLPEAHELARKAMRA